MLKPHLLDFCKTLNDKQKSRHLILRRLSKVLQCLSLQKTIEITSLGKDNVVKITSDWIKSLEAAFSEIALTIFFKFNYD